MILRKAESERSEEEQIILQQSPDVVSTLLKNQKSRRLTHERKQEVGFTFSVILQYNFKLMTCYFFNLC